MGIVNLLRGVMFWLENHNARRSHGIFYLGNINDSSVNVCVVYSHHTCVRASFRASIRSRDPYLSICRLNSVLKIRLYHLAFIGAYYRNKRGLFLRFFLFSTKRSTRNCSQYSGESKVVSVTNFWLGHGPNETVSPDMKFVSEHYTLFLKMPSDYFLFSFPSTDQK